jgi:hypothetical protein
MSKKEIKLKSHQSGEEKDYRSQILDLFKSSPIPENELLDNLVLFQKRQSISDLLFKHELYQKILDVNGVIMEFGVRWGKNLALFESLRGIYEPYNYSRKIIGFDTFSGFPSVHKKDGSDDIVEVGAYTVTEGYENYLEAVLDYHEKESPLSHIKKFELVKGDATLTLEKYLKENPQTIIALAYFDFDIYEPTKKCLELIRNHLTKGSIIGFDELNHPVFPGETIALKEALGLDHYRIMRTPFSPYGSYLVVE